jgi:DNA-binding transcriptional MocR family regulator
VIDQAHYRWPLCTHSGQTVQPLIARPPRGGGWAPGERLPSVAALAAELEAGHGTVRRALQRLADEGLVVILARYGTYRSRRGGAPRADHRAVDRDYGRATTPNYIPLCSRTRTRGRRRSEVPLVP